MILGIDVGNYSLKTSEGINIKALVSKEANILEESITLEMDGESYIIGEGRFETELNKSNKANFLPLLYAGIGLSTKDNFNSVVCGLPINQYKRNRATIEEMIENNKVKKVKINGKERTIVIENFKVYPEGLGAYYNLGINEDVIIIDIGGRTTDIAYISNNKPAATGTVAVGTLNILADIQDIINSNYSLDLTLNDIDKMLTRNSFIIDGEAINTEFIKNILRSNFSKIKEKLDLDFPARTEKIILVGGGATLFYKAFKNRYTNCEMIKENILSNAKGFKKVGEMLWQK